MTLGLWTHDCIVCTKTWPVILRLASGIYCISQKLWLTTAAGVVCRAFWDWEVGLCGCGVSNKNK
jgi:hypothetical protein